MPLILGISPATLLQIDGNLNLKIDETMKEKLLASPLVASFPMNGHTLIEMSLDYDEDEINEQLGEFSGAATKLHQSLLVNMKNDVHFSAS